MNSHGVAWWAVCAYALTHIYLHYGAGLALWAALLAVVLTTHYEMPAQGKAIDTIHNYLLRTKL